MAQPCSEHMSKQHDGSEALSLDTPTNSSCLQSLPRTLETLPAELRAHILSYITDLNDLRAVVHASPVLHQHYLLDRPRLLNQALRATLGSVGIDAYMLRLSAAFADKSCGMSQRSRGVEISDLTTQYYYELDCVAPDTMFKRWGGIDDAAAMASFYLTVAQPLVPECAVRLLQNKELKPEPLSERGVLSASERTRILRALYRF